jgi:hypothetical protein
LMLLEGSYEEEDTVYELEPWGHYNIIQFYRRTHSVGDSNEIRQWK